MQINHRPLTWLLSASALLVYPARSPLSAQSAAADYDEVDPWAGVSVSVPGPDSAAVAGFMRSLALADPLVCQLVAHSIGNNSGGGDAPYQPGILRGEDVQERARRALNEDATHRAALAHLATSLGD